jgi:hypothetical protein
MMPTNMVFRSELCLPCNLMFGSHPDKEESTIDYAADLVEQQHDIHHYAHQHLNVISD